MAEESKFRGRWVIFLVAIFITGIFIFALSDREKDPVMEEKFNNVTNSSYTIPVCEKDAKYKPETNKCWYENPAGHVIITFWQTMAFVFTILNIVIYEFKYWRIFLSSKILPFKNKYQDELRPIPKSPDIHSQKGFTWVWSGYDAILSANGDEVYVTKDEQRHISGNNIVLKGAVQQVSPKFLYNYLEKDMNLMREVMNNTLLEVTRKGKIINNNQQKKIFIIKPIHGDEAISFTTIKGHYGFGADRFTDVISQLYKSRWGLGGFSTKLTKAREEMLEDARLTTEISANIAAASSRTQDSGIFRGMEPQQQPISQNDNRRNQV